MRVTTHDIIVDGVTFIMEWRHPEDGDEEFSENTISLTEGCDADTPCKIVPERNGPWWECKVHHERGPAGDFTGGECPAFGICDSHETYDFKEVIA